MKQKIRLKIFRNISYQQGFLKGVLGTCFGSPELEKIIIGPYRVPNNFRRELPIFCGWTVSYLTHRAWHKQVWPMDKSGYLHLAWQRCMVAHPHLGY